MKFKDVAISDASTEAKVAALAVLLDKELLKLAETVFNVQKIEGPKGEQGLQGPKGEQGDRGFDGTNGKDGTNGADGRDGKDGKQGVSVQDAHIDFDGSLIITLTDGREINAGDVVPMDVAEKIKIIGNGGGTSQSVLDAIAALQATIATYGTMATQNANNVAITGGTINGTTVGATTAAAGTFTTLTANSTSQFGRSSANYVQAVGAASAAGPVVSSQGSDTNIDLNVTSKGSGSFKINNAGGTVAEFNDGGAATPANAFLFAAGAASGTRALIRAMGGPITLLSTGSNSVNFATNGASGNIQAAVSHTASAVNYVQVTGAATGNSAGPTISAQGSDSNVPLAIQSKLASPINFYTSGGFQQFRINNTASAVNFLQVTGGAAGSAPVLSAQGSDTNIPLVLQPKGTGALQAQQTDSTATGGNARGANAVDWQTFTRSSAAQVASGLASSVLGGARNTSNSVASTVVCGTDNTAGANNAFVGSGSSNTANGTSAAIVSGLNNSASGTFAFIGAGQANTTAGFLNVVAGGQTNSGTSGSAVTTQSATMNGTTAVTLSGSNASIKVGQLITGTSIVSASGTTPYTYVAAISGTSLTLSQAASGSSTSTLSFYTPHGVVVGGGNNQATGSYSFIGGGGDAGTAANRNVASGDWSTVGGGLKNSATNGYATVCGGNNNTVSGSSTTYGFIGGGQSNTVSGFLASVIGGYGNNANSAYSTASGNNTTTRSIQGVFAYSAGAFSATGDAQWAVYSIRKSTTDATPSVLTTDTSAASNYNQVILPNNSAYYFRGEVIAGVTGGGNTKGWTIEGVIKRGANAASTTVVGVTVSSMYADAGAVTWTIAAAADTTNGGLKITATGQAATTIRWVCKIETTEMTF